MAGARMKAVGKVYPGGTVALRDFDLELAEGEFMVLVGPSGCGKSSALRILSGLEAPSSGRIFIAERDVTDVGPGERDVAMVFQSYALYPHKSVRDNLGFGLRMRGASRDEIERRTQAIAKSLGLLELLDRRPAQLSGGQRQRVALGRALVRRPQLFLMDEPLSNLDAKLRLHTRAELARLHLEFGITTLYVTHDQEEAMTLGQRIAVLSEGGRIEQVGTPLEIYTRPASVFVADFIGTPSINWFTVTPQQGPEGLRLQGPDFELPAPPALGSCAAAAIEAGRELRLGIRPSDLSLQPEQRGAISARVDLIEMLGASQLVHARSASNPDIRVLVGNDETLSLGQQVHLFPVLERLHLFDPSSAKNLSKTETVAPRQG